MRVLGAILAGGQSRRFGGDKALAEIEGERMLDKVHSALEPQCDAVVLCGREEDGFICIPDRPEAGLGPLGGLNAALHHAAEHGFDVVLCTGCDVPNLPLNLTAQLASAPSFIESQPVIGLWPSLLRVVCEERLANGQRSMFGFAESVSARAVKLSDPLLNINKPEDLAKLRANANNQ